MIAEKVLSTQEVANRFHELAQKGEWEKVQDELYAENAVSIEPPRPGMQSVEGLDAIKKKGEMFNQMVAAEKKSIAIETALETNDYDGYVKATTPTRDEFTRMSEMHNQQKAIHAALEAKDYDAFVTAAKDTPMADITEEDFENMSSGKMVKLEKFEKRADKVKSTKQITE